MSELLVAPIVRDVVRVWGEHAASFLQGQLSQDVEKMGVNDTAWTFLLQPKGKVDAWAGVARLADDEFVLDIDPGHGDALSRRLQQFQLRVKLEQELRVGVSALAVRGAGSIELLPGEEGARFPSYERRANWPGLDGCDVIGLDESEGERLRPGPGTGRMTTAPHSEYERLRISRGVPAMGSEITRRTIPAELGQWVMDTSVSFDKGCYTGQELVARIASRGATVPRYLRVVSIQSDVTPPVGTSLLVGSAPVGELTSVAESAEHGGVVALAMVPRAVEVPTTAKVEWEHHVAPAHISIAGSVQIT